MNKTEKLIVLKINNVCYLWLDNDIFTIKTTN